MGQYQRLFNDNARNISVGVRLNPDLSYGDDPRFNPCRPHSKLGLHINDVPDNIDGIHFHTVFSRTDYQPLEEIVNKIERQLGNQLQQLKWINLGGGYLYQKISNHKPFIDVVKQLRQRYALDVYIEPGKAVVGDAAYLVSTVIDRFTSAGKQIAVLDTSVSHHPEVFEYQLSPTLLEANQSGTYACLLVGSSCLAGDVFGEYQFNYLPKIGDRVVFLNVGAYSLIKANRFNGYNLPDVYLLDKDRKLSLIKHSNYQQYHQQWG